MRSLVPLFLTLRGIYFDGEWPLTLLGPPHLGRRCPFYLPCGFDTLGTLGAFTLPMASLTLRQ